ncbi:hypothetical protein K438DRAFT_1992392 [Mycena galopus ATCC 62051]|nr:hypothetical protein K438DRAFT_1992392 [Mycena galopus ATCC 62051]
MASPDTTAAPDTGATTVPEGTIIYKKMTKAELHAAGLAEDPVFEYTITKLLPLFETKAQEPDSGGKLVKYVKGDLFDLIAAELDLGTKGYNLGAFKNTLYTTLKNNRNQQPKKKSTSITQPKKPTNPTTKPPKGRSAFDKLRERHHAEIQAGADKELVGVERTVQDGKGLAAFNRILNEQWSAVTDEEKAEMGALADENKAKRAAGPTAEDLAVSQANAGDDLHKALKAYIGHDWNQLGNTAFFLRGTYTNANGEVKRFFTTVGPEEDTLPFLSSDEERNAFRRWAKKVLKASAPTAHKQTDVMFPEVDGNQASLRFAEEREDQTDRRAEGTQHPVSIVIEGQFKVREYCRHILAIQKQGATTQVTPPAGSAAPAPEGANLVPPSPAAGPPAPEGDNIPPPPTPTSPPAPIGYNLVPPPPAVGPPAPEGDNFSPPPTTATPPAPTGDNLVPPPPPAGPPVPKGANIPLLPPRAGPPAPEGDVVLPPPPAGPLAPEGDVVPPPPPAGPLTPGDAIMPPPAVPSGKRGRPPSKKAKVKGKGKGKRKNSEGGEGAQGGNDQNDEPAPPKPTKRCRVVPDMPDTPPPSPRRLLDVRKQSLKLCQD